MHGTKTGLFTLGADTVSIFPLKGHPFQEMHPLWIYATPEATNKEQFV